MVFPPEKERPSWEKHQRPHRRQTSPGPLPGLAPFLPVLSAPLGSTDTPLHVGDSYMVDQTFPCMSGTPGQASGCCPLTGSSLWGGQEVGAQDRELPPNQFQLTTAYSRAGAGPVHKAWGTQLSSAWSSSAVAPSMPVNLSRCLTCKGGQAKINKESRALF